MKSRKSHFSPPVGHRVPSLQADDNKLYIVYRQGIPGALRFLGGGDFYPPPIFRSPCLSPLDPPNGLFRPDPSRGSPPIQLSSYCKVDNNPDKSAVSDYMSSSISCRHIAIYHTLPSIVDAILCPMVSNYSILFLLPRPTREYLRLRMPVWGMPPLSPPTV
jgi:hypothetical protein